MAAHRQSRLAIAMICACALAGCAKSEEEVQFELIECAGFHSQIPDSLLETVYREMRNRGVEPVSVISILTFAGAYRTTYTVTYGRGAEVDARWNKGKTAGKALAEKRDAAGIEKYVKRCTGIARQTIG